MENIQSHITQMYDTGSHNAVIVTDEGIIAGCSEEGLIGKKLVGVLPDYAGIWSLAKNTKGVAIARIKADLLYENLFATRSGNGWYLIVSESDWELYKSSYIQLIVTVLLSIGIHALKSTSKTIGAMELSEKALSLEQAAEREEADFIRDNYPGFASEYQKMVQAIAEITENE